MEDYQEHSYQDEAVRQIEDGPAVKRKAGEPEKQDFPGRKVDIEEIEIEEIHHLTEAKAVDQIAGRSSQHQTKPDAKDAFLPFDLEKKPQGYPDGQDRNQSIEILIPQSGSKYPAGILNEGYSKEIP